MNAREYIDKRSSLDGGLMSYGTNIVAVCQRVAISVDKILRGQASDLPVEQPTSLEFLINPKAAKQRA